jgi:uncharacterized protein (UPF0218 family)
VGGSASVLSEDLRAELRRRWAEVVEPTTGFVDYDDMRKRLSGVEGAGGK